MTDRRILYLGYWGIDDVLTASSVLPSLRHLSSLPDVSIIVFCTIERGGSKVYRQKLPQKVVHIALQSLIKTNLWITKFYDYVVFPQKVAKAIDRCRINTIICRSSLAGGLIPSSFRRRKIPLIIESFEPHSDYMVDSDIWTSGDFRTDYSRRIESALKKYATWLLPVSENYKHQLLKEGVPQERIRVLPCTVQPAKFQLNEDVRNKLRSQWNWNELVVGIYVGKFGGIYHDREAFDFFREAFEYFGERFALIILSGQPGVEQMVKTHMQGVPASRLKVLSVPHDAVPDYLSAADFAFSTIKPAPSRKYCSAIKHGEYWANGLPVILEKNIGDDSDIIEREGGGVVLKAPGQYREALQGIENMLERGRGTLNEQIKPLAMKYRDEALIERVYSDVFEDVG
jgi:hypothetical protein